MDTKTGGTGSDEQESGLRPFLILAFQARRPLASPVRFQLSEKSVVIGRAGEDELSDPEMIRIADEYVSRKHFSLEKSYNRWIFKDEGSRHGSFVDGAKVDSCELRDGAVIEAGRSFLVFREAEVVELAPQEGELFTLNSRFAAQLDALLRMIPTSQPILLRGETGSGKDVMARAVHERSQRKGAFQAINCAAVAAGVIEAELFGVKKGGHGTAFEDRPGHIRSADRGTLFLDEIGDLPLELQPKLLRVLEEKTVTPVGGTQPIKVDFRLVTATNRDLETMVAAGTFREELLGRIRGYTLRLPLLRERREDLGALVAALLREQAGDKAMQIVFSLEAARAIFRYDWPRNVRELKQALDVAVALSKSGRIDLAQLPGEVLGKSGPAPEAPVRVLSKDPDKRCAELRALLEEFKGVVAEVGRVLGVAPQQIYRWMRACGIDPEQYR
jgi:DNA-binding NtrC family response regulator